jgi:hypothetical protein
MDDKNKFGPIDDELQKIMPSNPPPAGGTMTQAETYWRQLNRMDEPELESQKSRKRSR